MKIKNGLILLAALMVTTGAMACPTVSTIDVHGRVDCLDPDIYINGVGPLDAELVGNKVFVQSPQRLPLANPDNFHTITFVCNDVDDVFALRNAGRPLPHCPNIFDANAYGGMPVPKVPAKKTDTPKSSIGFTPHRNQR